MDFLDSISDLLKEKLISENAKVFMAYPSLIDRVISFKEICILAKLKNEEKLLLKVLNGDYTKKVPLMTVGRFYKKYFGNFGKTLTYKSRKKGIIKVTMGEIDIAFTKISAILYNIYLQVVKEDVK